MGFECRFMVLGDAIAKGRPKFRRVKTSSAEFVQTYTPKKTRVYEDEVSLQAKIAMMGKAKSSEALRLHLVVTVRVPTSWSKKKQFEALSQRIYPTGKPDLDNLEKSIADACNGVVYADDSQIVEVVKVKRYGMTPGASVVIASMGDE